MKLMTLCGAAIVATLTLSQLTATAAVTRNAEGWTIITPSSDSRIVYVSNSDGNNSNDGLSPSTAKKTIQAGAALIRSGYPDHLLLKRGDVFPPETTGTLLGNWKSGRSQQEPVVVGSYGTSGARPVIIVSSMFVDHNGNVRNYNAFIGLDIYKANSDPNNSEYFSNVDSTYLMRFVGGGANLLVEDCRIRFGGLSVESWTNAEPREYSHVEIRRNIVTDGWKHNSSYAQIHTSGMYMNNVKGSYLIEENYWDHNGWNEDVPNAGANKFGHNMYIQYTNVAGGIMRGNIGVRPAAHGLHARSGGVVERNLFIETSVGTNIGGVSSPTDSNVHLFDNRFHQNVVIHGRLQDPAMPSSQQSTAIWGIIGAFIADIDVIDNIVANRDDSGTNTAYGTVEPPASLNLINSVSYKWDSNYDQNDPSWLHPDAGIEDYWASRGHTNSRAAYYTAQRNRAPGVLPWELTAYAAISYIREGFNRSQVSGYYTYPGQPGGSANGMITRDYWTGISGREVADLTSHSNFPNNPTNSDTLTSLRAVSWNNPSVTSNWGDSYGQRIYGYLHVPTTGNYTFWISSDDDSQLYISTDSNPANAALVAYVAGWTDPLVWNKYPSQKSASITLQAGQAYYIEILQKENAGGDNLAVGWAKPGQGTSAPSEVVPGTALSTWGSLQSSTGSIKRDYWTGIWGKQVTDLTSNANFPNAPSGSDSLSSFQAVSWNNPSVTSNWAESYGQRIYGYLHPPATGSYTFWIASDDDSQLYISTDANPTNAVLVAHVAGSSGALVWDTYSSQKSASITLQAGQTYYIEALHKENAGGDYLAVGWAKPGESTTAPSEIIPGSALSE